MDRRDWLKVAAGLAANVTCRVANATCCPRVSEYGAIQPAQPSVLPRFRDEFRPMRGIAKSFYKDNKNVFLWKHLEKELGEIVPHYQGPVGAVPGEGDCMGQAAALGCDVLAATDIHLRNENEKFVAKASVEMIYAGSRVEVGKGELKGRAGSVGAWAAMYLKEYGVLHRIAYKGPKGEHVDLSGYSPKRSRKYRDVGVPDWLEPEAKKHPVKSVTNVKTGMEILDAICAGQPVLLCSTYAFSKVRDKQGFARIYLDDVKTNRWGWRVVNPRVEWWHAMMASGALLEGGRIGALVHNSHGDWNSGPRPYGIPKGTFFVDLEALNLMARDWGDCWALGSYQGHEVRKIRKRIHQLWR